MKTSRAVLLLIILVFGAYFNSLNNEFVSDDIPTIRDNKEIESIDNVLKNPLSIARTIVVFVISNLFGKAPFFYHLLNIFLHLGCTLTAFMLLRLLFTPPVPLFAASIFAVHPILSEAVTWISGGPYVQYNLLILFTMFFYILSEKKKRFYFLSVFFCVLALLSCERTVVIPVILAFWEIGRSRFKASWKKLIPFFAIAGLIGFIHIQGIGGRVVYFQTQHYQEKGMYNPLIQIPVAITSYLELIFWPKALTFYHSELVFTRAQYILRLVIFILFLCTIVYSYRRRHRTFFWLSFFIINLLPTLTPFKISWVVAERYAYLSAFGIFVAVAMVFERISRVKGLKMVSYIVFALVITILLIRTIVRNRDWKNEDTLWFATARVVPDCPKTHNNLGDVYARRNDLEGAVREFRKAVELKPDYGDAYHNLAYTLRQMERYDSAIENYKNAISCNPLLWQSYKGLAMVYYIQGKYELVRDNMIVAVKINGTDSHLRCLLGMIYLKLGEKENGKAELQKALELEPDNITARRLLRQI